MAQEDVKENMNSSRNVKQDNRSKEDTAKNSPSYSKTGRREAKAPGHVGDVNFNVRGSLIKSTGARPHAVPRTRKLASFGSTALTATSRSRSTLSLTERNFSISDNTESCYNFSNNMKPKGVEFASSNLHNHDNGFQTGGSLDVGKKQLTEKHQQKCADVSSNENRSKDSDDAKTPEKTVSSGSFVLALDRVLEEKCISRLRGDITDTTAMNEPGKVRALDGGRLTNAQEIVVNVCHDDNRELIFHDNDEEALDNARAVSEIRINLWMKYNEDFLPDNAMDDTDIGMTEDVSASLEQTKGKAKRIVPIGNIQTHKEKTDKSWSDTPSPASRLQRHGKQHFMNTAAAKPRPGKRTGTRDISLSRLGSATFRQGCAPPIKKETGLKS